jgi:hypothetical protein
MRRRQAVANLGLALRFALALALVSGGGATALARRGRRSGSSSGRAQQLCVGPLAQRGEDTRRRGPQLGRRVRTPIKKLRIVTLRLGTARQRMDPLNDGHIPNPNVVRVAFGTGYHRVEGNRRASRNGPVSDLPPEIPKSRFALLHRCRPPLPRPCPPHTPGNPNNVWGLDGCDTAALRATCLRGMSIC